MGWEGREAGVEIDWFGSIRLLYTEAVNLYRAQNHAFLSGVVSIWCVRACVRARLKFFLSASGVA